jgi:long-chain acyl-CoA synthetase
MNLARSLQRVALSDPRRPALFHGPALLRDYAAFANRAARFASSLRVRGQPAEEQLRQGVEDGASGSIEVQ